MAAGAAAFECLWGPAPSPKESVKKDEASPPSEKLTVSMNLHWLGQPDLELETPSPPKQRSLWDMLSSCSKELSAEPQRLMIEDAGAVQGKQLMLTETDGSLALTDQGCLALTDGKPHESDPAGVQAPVVNLGQQQGPGEAIQRDQAKEQVPAVNLGQQQKRPGEALVESKAKKGKMEKKEKKTFANRACPKNVESESFYKWVALKKTFELVIMPVMPLKGKRAVAEDNFWRKCASQWQGTLDAAASDCLAHKLAHEWMAKVDLEKL